ncbi:SRPBCC family protein [Paenibacillus spongiae]|uniref:SRPBCC family protein n=1 Tax=Paenibacillus spongiae TaxID=2909671 RepID=A0ABY5S226_9BACL|nr:SRPBCC family protein [Paenibacillus spongiae]UVI27689.1 SRPBCC family protein [Paenibacillus spongiae]
MLAKISKADELVIARFERHLKHTVEDVWAMLTENDKLAQWFSELRIDDLREGGTIKFDMQDGTYDEMEIIEFRNNSVLEYTWDADRVRFELEAEPEGCRLVFIEKITKITDHTPRDIAGWDVCLDVIEAILDGRIIESRKDIWKVKYEEYVKVFEQLKHDDVN